MQFKVFFTATGSTMIEADFQADAEGKSENLSDEQVAEGIDSVEILDVAKVSDTDERQRWRRCQRGMRAVHVSR